MSHFTCYVVIDKKHFENVDNTLKAGVAFKEAEKMLAPFNEQDEKYAVFEDETDNLYKEYTGQETLDWDKKPIVKRIPIIYNKETGEQVSSKYEDNDVSLLLKRNEALFNETYEIREVIPNEYFKTFEEFVEDWHGFEKNEDGKFGSYFNPQAKWDWYQVGGRWTGAFLSKEQIDDNQVGTPGLMTERAEAGRVDIIRKGDIDIEKMVKEQKEKAKASWIEFQKYGIDLENAISWESLLKERDDTNIDLLRERYSSQPDFDKIEQYKKDKHYFFNCPIEDFCNGDYEKYMKKAEFSALSSFAILKDSKWFEKGEMGWFGVVTDKDENWEETWLDAFNSIDEDDWIINFDCHI
jgi:hypothetical protein